MRYLIGKMIGDSVVQVGYIDVSNNGTISYNSEDKILNQRLEEIFSKELATAYGVEGTNLDGRKVLAEIERVIKPGDFEFDSVIDEKLPDEYCVMDEADLNLSKTA